LVVVTRTEIGYCTEHSEILPSAHAVHLSILCRFWGGKKLLLLRYAAFID
jgi:hypothetical protein